MENCTVLIFFSFSAGTSFPVKVFPYNKKKPEYKEHMVSC